MVDARDLKSLSLGSAGSSPARGTKNKASLAHQGRTYMLVPWRNWIAQGTSNSEVVGSNPTGTAIYVLSIRKHQ
jgi:hypothetical protein